jgi:hypothetical protein
MAVATIDVETTHRNWTDVIKFPGRFNTVTYTDGVQRLSVVHRIVWATPAGVELDWFNNLERGVIVMKNLHHIDRARLRYATAVDNTDDVTIEPLLAIIIPNIGIFVGQPPPTIFSQTANDIECEIVYFGEELYGDSGEPD